MERDVVVRRGADEEWTPARIFLAIGAAWHLLLGIAGLFSDRSFPVGADEVGANGSGFIFGVFETNGWHTSAALFLGLLTLYFTIRPRFAREVALVVGGAHVLITLSFAVVGAEAFWFASNSADQFVHAASAIGGLASGLLTQPHRLEKEDLS